MSQAGNLAAVAPPAEAPSSNPKFQFTIPDSERILPTDPKVVVLRSITLAEEKLANQTSETLKVPFAYEALKHALVSADGSPVTWDGAGKERFIEGCGPRVRTLLLRAFERVHVPAEAARESFLGSMTVVV